MWCFTPPERGAPRAETRAAAASRPAPQPSRAPSKARDSGEEEEAPKAKEPPPEIPPIEFKAPIKPVEWKTDPGYEKLLNPALRDYIRERMESVNKQAQKKKGPKGSQG